MSGFYNMLLASGAPIGVPAISGETIIGNAANPSAAQAVVQFTSAGIVNKIENGVSAQIDTTTDWLRPAAAAPSLYQISATVQSGTSPTGDSLATFLPLTSNRQWTLDQSGVGTKSCTLLIELRYNGGTVLKSGTYSLSVTVV
jgi:hypothetical protein